MFSTVPSTQNPSGFIAPLSSKRKIHTVGTTHCLNIRHPGGNNGREICSTWSRCSCIPASFGKGNPSFPRCQNHQPHVPVSDVPMKMEMFTELSSQEHLEFVKKVQTRHTSAAHTFKSFRSSGQVSFLEPGCRG
ncbi:hypothetical protein GOODEAATRI_033272 [Goodea atripinnis]|uniref:Uncharacterized protein n=1 Tax=Goodea atripinnis TaxID=208336 RepID=A0ABV0NFR3_9TELE